MKKETIYLKEILDLNIACKIAFDKGLLDTHSGNIGMGIKGDVLITKTGRSLIDLKPQDFTVVPLIEPEERDCNPRGSCNNNDASSELEIHKFILKSFPGSTVLHSHPLNAIALSLILYKKNGNAVKTEKFKSSPPIIKKLYEKYPDLDKITPVDFESAYFFPEIYVFPLKFIEDIKTHSLSKPFCEAKDIFKENGVFMIKSHGSFSWGKTPLEALRWTMALEASSKIILKLLSAGNGFPPPLTQAETLQG
ncbi:MAG: class II aldolase/adducin family protein [bacterium]